MFQTKEQTITEDNIKKLVRLFYPSVLKDDIVGPFFIEKIGSDISSEEWQKHLDLLSSFWASMALGDTEYQGNPLAPHFDMPGISREAFERWLELFHNAVDRVYDERAGSFFKQKSTHIAGNFMRNLGL